jgi:adenylate cyclase
MAGYSRLTMAGEVGTARMLREQRAAADPANFRAWWADVKTTGDGAPIEFPSVVGAVQSAVALQNRAKATRQNMTT